MVRWGLVQRFRRKQDGYTLTRLSAVFGIHQALGSLHAAEREGVAWLRTPHGAPPFGGRPPLHLLAGGSLDGLMAVRRFLDAARGGVYMQPIEALDRDFEPYRDEDLHLSAGEPRRKS